MWAVSGIPDIGQRACLKRRIRFHMESMMQSFRSMCS